MSESIEAERLLLKFAELGILVTGVLEQTVDALNGSRDLVGNGVIDVLLRLDLYGSMRPGEIGSITGLSSGGVTKLIDRLEAEDLVVRRYGKVRGDARGVEVLITRTGVRMARALAEAFAGQSDAVEVFLKEINAMMPEVDAD